MATIIKINGQKEVIEPANGKTFSLEELQKAVNGYIQIVPINDGEYAGKSMVVDEDGKLKADAQLNIEASIIAGQRIVGQVLVIDRKQMK